MQYVLMIHVSESLTNSFSDSERAEWMQAYGQFHQEVQERGLMRGGAPLQPESTTTTVRIRESETMITDGPFAETKEQLAGIYILECKDLDEAIEVAKKIPDVHNGSIEIRPVFEKY